MARSDELKLELKVAELEEAFIEAKTNGTVTQEMKQELREARRQFRERRQAQLEEVAEGDAVVRPEPVTAGSDIPSPGGGGEGR